MPKEVVPVAIKGVMPTANGIAVFLGTEDKTFVIHVDHSVGNAMQMAMGGVKKERPLTHDLIGNILLGLGARIEHVIINDVSDGIYFARILLLMENEIGKKIVEIDARPSDSIVLALQLERPIYVANKVLDSVEDMTEVLERVLKQQGQTPQPEVPEEENSEEDDDEDEDEDSDEDSAEDEK